MELVLPGSAFAIHCRGRRHLGRQLGDWFTGPATVATSSSRFGTCFLFPESRHVDHFARHADERSLWLDVCLDLGCDPCLWIRYRDHFSTDQTFASNLEAFPATTGSQWPRLKWVVGSVLLLFVMGQQLGAMSPQTDFDVLEYHLGGPKEWFQQGQIVRLPHNVYTSFPFLTEMLILSGMVLYGDWQWGALAGQAVIGGFAPLTAIGLLAASKRWFSAATGWVAALVFLTSPWTYRVTIIAYAEGGLACYLFAAFYAALLYGFQDHAVQPKSSGRSLNVVFLSGLLAGSAMACKYTGLVLVVMPAGLLLIWMAIRTAPHFDRRKIVFVSVVYAAGAACTIGPWLLKNTIETGNPVYPLAVRIFGGIDRDEAIDEKWRKGHANTYSSWSQRLRDLPVKLTDVAAKNDWHSPLMFGLAPLSLLVCFRRHRNSALSLEDASTDRALIGALWFYVIWQFVNWWLFTHHIDRFYVPMFAAVAMLAGIGAHWWERFPADSPQSATPRWWTTTSSIVVVAAVLYNLNIMLLVGGFNAGRLELNAARRIAISQSVPRQNWINEQYEAGNFPANTRVLCVGEALLFHARYPYLYNTVFDHSIFEKLCVTPDSTDNQLRPVAEILAEFQRLGITHVEVGWAEILRYREPGSYGYTDFVHPDRFAQLQQLGVLGPAVSLPADVALSRLDSDRRTQLEGWAPSLMTSYRGEPAYIAAQLFPVITTHRAESHTSEP